MEFFPSLFMEAFASSHTKVMEGHGTGPVLPLPPFWLPAQEPLPDEDTRPGDLTVSPGWD
jgi:hypothetical protein